MSPIQQLLIVGGILLSLPLAVKLLWKLYLFPLGCWFVATHLFWPKWAEANARPCFALLAGCILFFLVAWTLRYAAKRRREREWIEHALATGTVLDYRPRNTFHGETD